MTRRETGGTQWKFSWTVGATGRSRPIPVSDLLLALVVAMGVGGTCLRLGAQEPPPGSPGDRASAGTPISTPVPTARPGEYRIAPDDVLDVYVYDVPELSREYTVNSVGTITIPLLPRPIEAGGLTPDQLAHSLEESFRTAGRLSHPQITVSLKQSRVSVVTVEGAVKSPQTVPVIGPTKLVSVLFQCGGRADDAGNTLKVTRGEIARRDLAQEGEPAAVTTNVEFKRLMDPNDPTSKLDVWPGDRVSVDHAGLFYVLGQVSRPGGYNLKSADEQVSVLQALALAGDATAIAKIDKTMILRKNPKAPNGREEIALNVKDILKGRSPDQVLQADDILYIPVSGSRRALRGMGSFGQAMANAAGGAAIYTRF